MHPRLAFLLLPCTRAELPGWSRVMPMRPESKALRPLIAPRAAPTREFSDWLWK